MWKGNAVAPVLDFFAKGIRVGLGSRAATRNDGFPRCSMRQEAAQRIAGMARDDFSCGAGGAGSMRDPRRGEGGAARPARSAARRGPRSGFPTARLRGAGSPAVVGFRLGSWCASTIAPTSRPPSSRASCWCRAGRARRFRFGSVRRGGARARHTGDQGRQPVAAARRRANSTGNDGRACFRRYLACRRIHPVTIAIRGPSRHGRYAVRQEMNQSTAQDPSTCLFKRVSCKWPRHRWPRSRPAARPPMPSR